IRLSTRAAPHGLERSRASVREPQSARPRSGPPPLAWRCARVLPRMRIGEGPRLRRGPVSCPWIDGRAVESTRPRQGTDDLPEEPGMTDLKRHVRDERGIEKPG